MTAFSGPSRLALVALVLGACAREQSPAPEAHADAPREAAQPEQVALPLAPAASPALLDVVAPYPPARWRLASTADLDRLALWFSQILIRHTDARVSVSFNVADWFSVPPRSTRSRAEALALAEQVATLAAQDPSRFAALARQYSEDLPRRDEGGALGSVQASLLTLWPQVLDTLAAIEPGQPSRVIETRFGFHILMRSAPPPEQVVSGAHIVIGHASAEWLVGFAREGLPERSREEALELANEVYRKASAEPGRFAELVRLHSEHRDAIVGGDLGAWSTREPIAYTLRAKRLLELADGEVGSPVETHLGFEIIQRTPARPRPQYRARVLGFSASDDPMQASKAAPGGEAAAFARASAAAQTLSRDPAAFDELASRAWIEQWQDGQYVSGLTYAFQQLRPGQVTPVPVESEYGFLVAQRLEPVAVEPASYLSELPSPEHPDLEHVMGMFSPEGAEAFLRLVVADVERQLPLDQATAERLRAIHELEGRIDANMQPDARMSVLDDIRSATLQLLGTEAYKRYNAVLENQMVELVLSTPPSLGF